MSRGDEKAKRWQFGIRGLLWTTAVVAMATGVYCIHVGLGVVLATIVAALCGGGLLRRATFDCEHQRNYGIFASILGGAIAGACNFGLVDLVVSLQEISIDFSEPGGIPVAILVAAFFGGMFGGVVGFVVWLGWLVVVTGFLSIRDLVVPRR